MITINHPLSQSELTDLAFVLGAQTKQQDRYLVKFEACDTRIDAVFTSNRGVNKDIRETVYRLPQGRFDSMFDALEFLREKTMDFNKLMGINLQTDIETDSTNANVIPLRSLNN